MPLPSRSPVAVARGHELIDSAQHIAFVEEPRGPLVQIEARGTTMLMSIELAQQLIEDLQAAVAAPVVVDEAQIKAYGYALLAA